VIPHQVQTGDKKVLHGKRSRKKEYESKGKEIEFTVQTSGEFQCPQRHSRALFILAGCGVKRAAATAGHIYSDKSLHTLKSLSRVYLFKRQQTQLKL